MSHPNDPYIAILEAGAIRREANKLAMQADHIEQGARIALDLAPGQVTSHTVMPGMVYVLAHGGRAHGQEARLPANDAREFDLVPTTGATIEELAPSRYEPVIVVKLGQFPAGMIAVPKGGRRAFVEGILNDHPPQPGLISLAKMLVNVAGFNPELVDALARDIKRTFGSADLEGLSETPMLVQLQ